MKKVDSYNFFSLYIGMKETTYWKRKIETILKIANNYYQNNKEKLREKARNEYRELSEEDKKIKTEYEKNRYHNISKEKSKH